MLSISHQIVDGATYYRIYNMLLKGIPIVGLNPIRIENLKDLRNNQLSLDNLEDTPGYMISCLRGLIVKLIATTIGWKSVQHTYNFILVDSDKIQQIKNDHTMQQQQQQQDNTTSSNNNDNDPKPTTSLSSSSSYISTNDIISSWFFNYCHCKYGGMLLNMRSPRCSSLSMNLAGNYEEYIHYRVSEDIQQPHSIRQSLLSTPYMQRIKTKHKPFTSWEMLFEDYAVISNWSTFHIENKDDDVNNKNDDGDNTSTSSRRRKNVLYDCHLMKHMPFFDPYTVLPCSSLALCVIYQVRKDQLGLLLIATPSKMKKLMENIPFEQRI